MEGEPLRASHQLLFSPLGLLKSLVLRFNEALLTVPFEHGASEGAALPAQAWHGVLEPGACGTGFSWGSNEICERGDVVQDHSWATHRDADTALHFQQSDTRTTGPSCALDLQLASVTKPAADKLPTLLSTRISRTANAFRQCHCRLPTCQRLLSRLSPLSY